MKIMRSILGIIGVMLFFMGAIYGDLSGIYLSSAAIFIILYAIGIPKWITKKIKIEINFPSELFLIGSIIFIYLSFWEKDITIYNIIMSICCTILSWLFIFYLNIPAYDLNIEKNIENIKNKYKNYKNPPKTLLNKSKIINTEENYQNSIDEFFKTFDLKMKYIETVQNSWLLTYKYEISGGIRIDDILELDKDLKLKLNTELQIEVSTTERNIIYIKIPKKDISNYKLINDIDFINNSIEIPLGEDDEGNKIKINLQDDTPLLLLGQVGTGKTNLLNVIISTLLFHNTPQELNLILIDKHQTGLDIYQNLPHLALPLLNNPNTVIDYLKSIQIEIERRKNIKETYPKIVVIIDEIFGISSSDEEICENLEPLIIYGKEVGIYTIITSSILNKTPVMEYLYNKIDKKIYFYGRNIEEYNPYQNKITELKGIINMKIDNTELRIRTPKIDSNELKGIVENVKGIK